MFSVFLGSTLVGYTALDFEDLPAGIAKGLLEPLPAYATLQAAVIAAGYGDQRHLQPSVVRRDGVALPIGFRVAILDDSRCSNDPADIEVHLVAPSHGLLWQFTRPDRLPARG
jgi:hypothetical protein